MAESLPYGHDQDETQQQFVPGDEFINTHENKTMLAAEDQALKSPQAAEAVRSEELQATETLGEEVEKGMCTKVGKTLYAERWSSIIYKYKHAVYII